jgi:hypothetical protein
MSRLGGLSKSEELLNRDRPKQEFISLEDIFGTRYEGFFFYSYTSNIRFPDNSRPVLKA